MSRFRVFYKILHESFRVTFCLYLIPLRLQLFFQQFRKVLKKGSVSNKVQLLKENYSVTAGWQGRSWLRTYMDSFCCLYKETRPEIAEGL